MWIQQTTMGWLVYDLTSSGSLLGAMNGVRSFPTLLVTPFAGVTADRVPRNVIIGISQIALAALAILLAVAIALDVIAVWHLFLFTILAGMANAFNMPARQTMVFDVVDRESVPNAVALNNLAMSLMRMVGPLVGGVLIAAFGAASNFSIQAIAYLTIMVTVLIMKLPAKPTRPASREAISQQIFEGYRFVFGSPQGRLLILMMLINPIFLIPLHLALLPIFAKDILEGGASSLGIMLGSLGGGGILGGLIVASLNRIDRRGLVQLAGLFIHSACHAAFAFFGWLTGDLWLVLPFLIAAGAAESLHMTTNQTVLQLFAPDHLRGRVTSVLQFTPVFMSLGVFTCGVLADIFGAPAVGTVFSLCGFGVTLGVSLLSPRMRNLRLSQLRPEVTDR
jgi:MFS family permease